MRTPTRLSLNRETLRRIDPAETHAVAAGVDRLQTVQFSANGYLCSVSMGVTGNSLGCTGSTISSSLVNSVLNLGTPH